MTSWICVPQAAYNPTFQVAYHLKLFYHSTVVIPCLCMSFKFSITAVSLTLSGPGGGGSEARMAKLTAANQKPLILWCPNLVTFSFYPWDTFWPHFSKISLSGGLLLLFSHRDVPKILKMKNFSYAWKLLKVTWGVNFWSRRTILDIKTHFFKVKPVFRG